MCQDCGCSDIPEGMVKIYAHDHSHDHDHPHTHDHAHDHEHHHHHEHNTVDSDRRTISVSQSILSQNDRLAERNRG